MLQKIIDVINGIQILKEAVLNIPDIIEEFILDMKNGIIDKINNIIRNITDLPSLMIEKLKDFLLPDTEFINSKLEHFRARLLSMGVDTYDMGHIFNKEQPFEDLTANVRGHKVVVVNMNVVDLVVKKFRPVIRGFLWLMLVFYNFNQFMGFIGQQGVTVGSIIRTATSKGDDKS